MVQSKAPLLDTDRLQKLYQKWLECAQTQVLSLVEQLMEEDGQSTLLLMPSEEITKTLSAVDTLRVFAHFSARPLFKEDGSKKTSAWIETTYLAWLAVRRSVLKFGCADIGRRILAEYWSDGQPASLNSQRHESQPFYVAVGLLYATLDLPCRPDIQEASKRVPVSSLVDYFLWRDQ
ncbi:hypothetical protein GGI22_003440 [Coemansia erecta]|nr:hypothetical protein GGI22_003440 [Coemansia erecta]